MKLFARSVLGAGFLLVFLIAPAASANSGQTTVACADGHVTYSPTTLWPPNHKLQLITISYTQPCDEPAAVGGPEPGPVCGGPVSLKVDSITQNEEPPGSGCGQPTSKQGSDWTGVGDTASAPTEPATVTVIPEVRAERCGTGQGRTYTITVTCTDDTESGTATLQVTVPHNQGG